MSEGSISNGQAGAAPAGAAPAERDPGVVLVLNSEDSAPFDLEPVLIPLGIPQEQFKSSVGGAGA